MQLFEGLLQNTFLKSQKHFDEHISLHENVLHTFVFPVYTKVQYKCIKYLTKSV